MRISFATALALMLLSSGSYFYWTAQTQCPAPLTYTLHELDERFGLSSDEAQRALAKAESIWEEATGEDLFTYEKTGGDLAINFTFDDRQALLKKEETFKETLDETQGVSAQMQDTYTKRVADYNTKRLTFNEASQRYELRLSAYNAEVEKYNGQGGASAEVFARLQGERRALSLEESKLNTQIATLNGMVAEINALGEQANHVVNTYNESVDVYNKTFGGEREFVQGDYKDGVIHIYTFDSEAELVLVLVHELGHALSLQHVEHSDSVMHYLLRGGDGQSTVALSDIALTSSDLVEFDRVCGKKTFSEVVAYTKERVLGGI